MIKRKNQGKEILWFDEVSKEDIPLVGGKGANLGEMTQHRLPIPYGFIITAQVYFNFIQKSGLESKIAEIIKAVNYDRPTDLQNASMTIREMIDKTPFPKSFFHKVIDFYERLLEKENNYLKGEIDLTKKISFRLKHLYRQPFIAVRSSATAEDLPTASFAGQQETYLNVRGETNLVRKIKQCWSSLFTERAIYYRHQQGFDKHRVGLAVVVQRMVQSDKSGIAFSIEPVSNDRSKITIEAIYGLGEYIVGGKVTPDHYLIDKNSFLILEKKIIYQNLKFIRQGIVNKEIKLSKKEGSQQKLSDEEIIKVAMLVKQIENLYHFPQDIEWAIEGDTVYIVQSRPITTIKKPTLINTDHKLDNNIPILTGAPASPGIASGPVKIIFSPDMIDKISSGDILVAPQTNPDYVPAMKKAAAIITEKGGRTSHAAIVSREMGIPAVVGVEQATKKLKNQMIVTVNGTSGEIFKGAVKYSPLSPKTNFSQKTLKTLTKLYVNLAEPNQAKKIAQLDVDGVGLLRAEFMIAEIGIHPKEFIHQKKEKIFVDKLTKDLLQFVKPFNPRPIIYRATDFKTNEYRHLSGGKRFEPVEENPMLGFRGASRYLANPDVFGLELQAISNIWQKGFQNLHLMIPFVRRPWEIIKIKEYLKNYGLFNFPGFKLWIMVEVPAVALDLESFLKIGLDGVSIGTNDLTMMLLGVDRDNHEVANIYDERTPVVIEVLKNIVTTCKKNHVTCSICGQAPSDYPEIVEILVKAGITSISVNPDAIERTRELISNIEKKIYSKKV